MGYWKFRPCLFGAIVKRFSLAKIPLSLQELLYAMSKNEAETQSKLP